MSRLVTGGVLVGAVAWASCLGAVPAQAKVRCVRHGESVVAHSQLLIAVTHDNGPETRYVVCRRATGKRRTLGYVGGYFRYAILDVKFVRLHGRFAYAVQTSYGYSDGIASDLVRVDTHTWKRTQEPLQMGDRNDAPGKLTAVTALVPARHGRAVLRVRSGFAAGIVIADQHEANYIDEGLETSIGRPQVSGDTVTWRRGPDSRTSPVVIPDRCPSAPRSSDNDGVIPTIDSDDPVLATGDAVTHLDWYCVRATGAVGHLDGTIVRLLGSLAVVQRPADTRIVDLRTQAVVNGPVSPRTLQPTVGRSATLVYRYRNDYGVARLLAVAAGQPPRTLAIGIITNVRYEDGLLRYDITDPNNAASHRTVTQPVP